MRSFRRKASDTYNCLMHSLSSGGKGYHGKIRVTVGELMSDYQHKCTRTNAMLSLLFSSVSLQGNIGSDFVAAIAQRYIPFYPNKRPEWYTSIKQCLDVGLRPTDAHTISETVTCMLMQYVQPSQSEILFNALANHQRILSVMMTMSHVNVTGKVRHPKLILFRNKRRHSFNTIK